jgi:hypothetical protein
MTQDEDRNPDERVTVPGNICRSNIFGQRISSQFTQLNRRDVFGALYTGFLFDQISEDQSVLLRSSRAQLGRASGCAQFSKRAFPTLRHDRRWTRIQFNANQPTSWDKVELVKLLVLGNTFRSGGIRRTSKVHMLTNIMQKVIACLNSITNTMQMPLDPFSCTVAGARRLTINVIQFKTITAPFIMTERAPAGQS